MLFLVFQVAGQSYTIAASDVVEVLPRVQCRPVPHAAPAIAGIFDYHGTLVPVIDLSVLLGGGPVRAWMSTRVMLVNYRGDSGETHRIGLLAEQVTETVARAASDFRESGLTAGGAPYLGRVTNGPSGIMQRIHVENVLPEEIRCQLFVKG